MNLSARPFRSWIRGRLDVAAAAVAFGLSATCSDQPPVAPRTVAPGHAAFSLAPRFTQLPASVPAVALSKVSAVLTSPDGTRFAADAPFVGDSAVLTFEVPIAGSSAVFGLRLTAFDTRGEVAYTSTQDLTLHPGDNPPPETAPLVYAAPDSKVTAIKITSGALTLKSGATASLAVTGTNASGQAISPIRVGWSSADASIATVDQNGVVTAGVNQGSTTITAVSASNVTDAVSVKVQAPVSKVTLSPSSLTLPRGKTTTLTAELRDAGNHLIDDRTVTWSSSDPTVVSVSAGAVTANKIGTATLTANAEGKSGSMSVTVVTPVDHIEFTVGSLQFNALTQTFTAGAKLVPVAGASVDGLVPAFSSSAPNIVTVDAAGVATSVANGTARVTASIDGLSASVDATVKQVAAASTVSPHAASVSSLGAPSTFTASFVDAKGIKIDAPKVTWTSSDPTVATVAGTGVVGTVIPLRSGSATITATSDGKSDAASFIVAPTVSTLIVSADKAQIAIGETATLSARFGDAQGNPLGLATATYSSTTPNIATVSGNVVTGLSVGTAHIVGVSGNLTGSFDIKVSQGGGGSDLLVFEDFNLFTDAVAGSDPTNATRLARNLLSFGGTKPRSSGTGMYVYYGNGSQCYTDNLCRPAQLTTIGQALAQVDNSVTYSDPADFFPEEFDPSIKTVLIMTPTMSFENFDVNTMKEFLLEGGRIVFVGDNGLYYANFTSVENDLLSKMGSALLADASSSASYACSIKAIPASSIRSSQVTTGLTGLTIGCAGQLFLGSGDAPLLYDETGLHVIAATAAYDPNFIAVERVRRSKAVRVPVKSSAAASLGRP